MILLDNQLVKKVDSFLISNLGFDIDLLVENAGLALFEHIDEYLEERLGDKNKKKRKVNIFFGKGSNGLDVLVCARLMFINGYDIKLWQTFSNKDYSSKQLDICNNLGINVHDANNFQHVEDEIIVDGIFGSSFDITRGISPDIDLILKKINKSKNNGSFIISADIPTGVDATYGDAIENAINADLTVTFIWPKIGNVSQPGKTHNGKLVVDTLNLPIDFLKSQVLNDRNFETKLINQEYVTKHLSKRQVDGHKGTFGKIGIIGGSIESPGAIILSTLAAMRSGAGLVYLSVPEDIKQDCIKTIPEAVISSDTSNAVEKSDVLLIGPGIAETKENFELIINAILNHPKLVLDAGALNLLSTNMALTIKTLKRRSNKNLQKIIITPHPKELDRLFPGSLNSNRIKAARDSAKKLNSVVVLKGNATVICDDLGNTHINSSGNSALAKGGSGDVLSGIIASIFKSNSNPLEASAIGVFIHGTLGDMCSSTKSEYSVLPTDLIKELPEYFKNMSLNEGEY